MPDPNITRRLAAILAADVVDFSRLMSVDEVGTLNNLKAHRKELVDPSIAHHNGRIVKTTGDGMLVEFASVIDAVGCAVAIQRGMFDRNNHMQKENCIVFRIGINVGDIIVTNPTNASPPEIAQSVGDEVGKRIRSQFSDGGF